MAFAALLGGLLGPGTSRKLASALGSVCLGLSLPSTTGLPKGLEALPGLGGMPTKIQDTQ